MADRSINFDPTVTQVTPEKPDLGLLEGASAVADTIAQQSANAKALNATAQTALGFRQLDVAYRESTAGNPNDPEALATLQGQRSALVSQIAQQVPAITQRDYMAHTIQLQESSDKLNEFWGMHQQMRNAESDLSTARDTELKTAGMAGKQFAQNGDMGDLGSVLNFESSKAAIEKFVTPIVGAPKAEAYLKDFSGDWVKSFVANVAESNPQKAALMLQQPQISEHFTAQNIGDMADVIKKTTRQQQLIQNMQTTKNDGAMADIINNQNTSYFEKRAAIDKMDAEGSVTPKSAAAARRVIKSTEDLESQTDTPKMADIINKAYDLNANASTSADDYLKGVQNLHTQILEAQAEGSLTGRDAMKVTRQINDLTGKKMADATNTAGMEFYDANQKFTELPPEYRGQATRALFYAGQGQSWTPAQYGNQATQIIQQINSGRRAQAQKTLNSIIPQQDSDFLKTVPNASPEAIKATADKYGISTQQVILQLRANAVGAARAKQNSIKRIAPGGGEDDGRDEPKSSPGPKLDTSAPSMEDEQEIPQ